MNVYSLYTDPKVPTLMEQGKQALGLDGNYQTSSTPPPRQPRYEEYLQQAVEQRYNPLAKMVEDSQPVFDQQRADRLKSAAKWNAIGNALSTAYSGYIGTKGGPIPNIDQSYPIQALNDYQAMLSADKEQKLRAQLAKMGLLQDTMNRADANMQFDQRLSAAEVQRKAKEKIDKDKMAFNEKKLTSEEERFKVEQERKTKDSEQRHEEKMAAIKSKGSGDGEEKKEDKKVITFTNKQTGKPDSMSYESAIALVNSLQDKIEKGAKDRNGQPDPNKVRDLEATPGLYRKLNKLRPGGYNMAELKAIIQEIYDIQVGANTKIFSDNDMAEAYQRNRARKVTIKTPDEYGEPAPKKPTKQGKEDDPYQKYLRK